MVDMSAQTNYIAEPFIGLPRGDGELSDYIAEALADGRDVVLNAGDICLISDRIRALTEIAEQNMLVKED